MRHEINNHYDKILKIETKIAEAIVKKNGRQ